MKWFASTVLFLFIIFLAAPTVISILQDDTDTSLVYSLTEEELQKEIKEIKAAPANELRLSGFFSNEKTEKIHSADRVINDNVSREVCSPPPEFV